MNERRKRVRTAVQLPIQVLSLGGIETDWVGTTRDLSSGGGVRFECPHPATAGEQARYIVTLSQGNPPVKITCEGRVVRCLPIEGTPSYEIVFTMDTYRFLR